MGQYNLTRLLRPFSNTQTMHGFWARGGLSSSNMPSDPEEP